ncbi:unnamed protein product [Onchocerca flexuosa]|uniref:Uncharacterized protein n=1 Tax=Onchocerca flexuosa TaxID=387005 RepID=A0A183HWR2_9BILA|nr:unnamed protein product [Onchocerca flexuosa]
MSRLFYACMMFYRYECCQRAKFKKKKRSDAAVITNFIRTVGSKNRSLNVSTENILQQTIQKYKQNNITEAIAPTLEDLRNFHYSALLGEYILNFNSLLLQFYYFLIKIINTTIVTKF